MEYKRVVIKGFKGHYEIDTNGVIYSLPRVADNVNGGKQLIKGGIKKHKIHSSGYWFITFKYNGTFYNLLVHRLLAEAFIPNPHSYPQVNHKDGNKLNLALDNLEWCTQSYNNHHAVDVLGKKNVKHIKCLETGQIFTSQNKAAKALKITRSELQNQLNGTRSCIKDYTFQYVTTP